MFKLPCFFVGLFVGPLSRTSKPWTLALRKAAFHSTITIKMADKAKITAQAKVKVTGISAHSFKCLGVAQIS